MKTDTRLAVAPPWYVHPAEDVAAWTWLRDSQRDLSFVVVNVSNGPGAADDAYYPWVLCTLETARVVGYVDIGYGRRPHELVFDDITAWITRYGVHAVMFDQVPTGPASLQDCARIVSFARSAGIDFVVANPGTYPTAAHMHLFDVTCAFEGSAADYALLVPPPQALAVPATRIWHLIYECEASEVAAVLLRAHLLGAAHVYVTDGSLPHPWGAPTTAVREELLRGCRTRRFERHRLLR